MTIDISIDPTGDQIRHLRDKGPDGPIVMVNLLKFRAHADYSPGAHAAVSTGREAYALYEHAFTVTVGEVSKAEIIFRGPVNQLFIGRTDEPANDWDDVLVVRYPSRQHFLAMLAHPTYKEALHHRYAGLERTLLLQCRAED